VAGNIEVLIAGAGKYCWSNNTNENKDKALLKVWGIQYCERLG
jgi:hypothetical protein